MDRQELTTDRERNEIATLQDRFEGPGEYTEVLNAIRRKELPLPTGAEVASLLWDAYKFAHDSYGFPGTKPHFVRDIMKKNNGVFVPNRALWTPKHWANAGVYVQHDCEAIGLSKKMDVDKLEADLSGGKTLKGVRFSKNEKTAFAPLNTIIFGRQEPIDLTQNGFIIANFGVEGTNSIFNVASRFVEVPDVYVGVKNSSFPFLIINEPIQTLLGLMGDYRNYPLDIYATDKVYDACAFGMPNLESMG